MKCTQRRLLKWLNKEETRLKERGLDQIKEGLSKGARMIATDGEAALLDAKGGLTELDSLSGSLLTVRKLRQVVENEGF